MYNTIIYNDKEYKVECVWRKNKATITKDKNNVAYPYPVHKIHLWGNKNKFLEILRNTNNYLDVKEKYEKYEKSKNCLICKKKDISTKRYIFNNYIWEDGLYHYIDFHNIEPSNAFKKFIFQQSPDKEKLDMVLNRRTKDKEIFVEITKNQLLILDALMIHGGYDKKYSDINEKKYSEHAGLLDFEKQELTRIIVSANISRIDSDDEEIYLPEMEDMHEYEYMFHTHPPTPKAGGRANEGTLYEFPSIGDIFHFIENHNKGNVIGSLVVCAEGLYNIRKKEQGNSDIKINDDALYKKYNRIVNKVQMMAIKEYGSDFTDNKFYKTIAQNTKFIYEINTVLSDFNLCIDYYPRTKDKNNKWYIDTVFLSFRKNK